METTNAKSRKKAVFNTNKTYVLLAILLMCLIVYQKNVLEEFQVVTTMKKLNVYHANNIIHTMSSNKHVSLLVVTNTHKQENAVNAIFHSNLLQMDSVQSKTVSKSIKKDVINASKIIKSIKMEHAHLMIQTVLQGIFMRNVLAANKVFMLTKIQDAKQPQ